ncbi:MAG: DUF4157 domain-containing protein [Bacteroidia bacterium]
MSHERTSQQRNSIHQQHDDWNDVHEQLLAIQKKSFNVSSPGDADEKEADDAANKIMAGESVDIHGTGGTINNKSQNEFETTSEFQSQLLNSKGGGQSLDDSTRSEMESKMGENLSNVKIHAGDEANTMNESVNAKAFAHGQDIYFKQGEFNPDSEDGKQLLAHELTHTVQQGNGNKLIQKTSIKPDVPASSYMPSENSLNTSLGKKTAEERKSFLEVFIAEMQTAWDVLNEEKLWYQIKDMQLDAKDQAILSQIEPVPSDSRLSDTKTGKQVVTSYKTPNIRLVLTQAEIQTAESLLNEQSRLREGEIDRVLYDQTANKQIAINNYIDTADETTLAIEQLRNVQTVLFRVYTAFLVSRDGAAKYTLPEILALYQQEGNKEMPASFESLQQGIPTGVTNSASYVGYGNDKIEISQGVLALNPDFVINYGGMPVNPDKPVKNCSDYDVRFFAFKLYANHIGGLDVIHQYKTLGQLATWSADNLKAIGKLPTPTTQPDGYAQAKADALIKWTATVNNLGVIRKTDAVIIAPHDPVSFVQNIVSESMIYKDQYSDMSRIFGDTPMADLPAAKIPISLTYMQFNSSSLQNLGRPKDIIVSAVSAVKTGKSARYADFRKEADLIKTVNFAEVKKWMLGEIPYESIDSPQRWFLAMDFIEHAGYEDWGANWGFIRGNASLLRSQSEFYELTMGEEERNFLKGKDRLEAEKNNAGEKYYYRSELDRLLLQWKTNLADLGTFNFEILPDQNTWSVKASLGTYNFVLPPINRMPVPNSQLEISGKEDAKRYNGSYIQNPSTASYTPDSKSYAPGMEYAQTSLKADEWGFVRANPFVFDIGDNTQNFLFVPDPLVVISAYEKVVAEMWKDENIGKMYLINVSAGTDPVTGIIKSISMERGLYQTVVNGSPQVLAKEQVWTKTYSDEETGLYQRMINLNTAGNNQLTQLGFYEPFTTFLQSVIKQEGPFRKTTKLENQLQKTWEKQIQKTLRQDELDSGIAHILSLYDKKIISLEKPAK